MGGTLGEFTAAAMTFRPAHVLTAALAHCVAESADPIQRILPDHDRLVELAPPRRVRIASEAGPYYERPLGPDGFAGTFRALCARLGLITDSEGVTRYGAITWYRLLVHNDTLRDEERAAIRWLEWLGTLEPPCMAAHVAFLHHEDLNVLCRLARGAAAEGRRGADSLYGILVRAVYAAFTELLFTMPGTVGPLPLNFPVGPDFVATQWLTHPYLIPGSRVSPDLCLGDVIACVRAFGSDSWRVGHAPRMVAEHMLLADFNTRIPAPSTLRDVPDLRHLDPSAWDPDRYYAQNTSLLRALRDAADVWTCARHPYVLGDRPPPHFAALRNPSWP
jgi:hypothetical protein